MRFQKPALASNTSLAGRQIKNTSQRDAFGFEISAFVSVIKIQAILKFDRRWDHRAPDGLSSIQLSWYCSNGRGFMLPSWFLSDSLRDIHRAWADLTFLSEKEYSIRGGLSRGRGLNPHDGLLGLLLAHMSVWIIKNDRILNSSAQRIKGDKRNISTDKINIKKLLEK